MDHRTRNRPASTRMDEAEIMALQALVWTLACDQRAERLLTLTGLDPATLRAAAGDRATLAAIMGFLASHEPDLVACADALDVTPGTLGEAARLLNGEGSGA